MSPRRALVIFIALTVFVFAQAAWWIIFMAILVDEKVEMARALGATPEYVARIHEEEIRRQVMLGFEGTVFLLLVLVGAWLIYRALVRSEQLKFHQRNFMMAVTHELKTPLASLKVGLESLTSPKIDAARRAEVLPRMREDVARLERLVEDVLEAGRFERDNAHLRLEPVDFSRLVAERLEALRSRANRKQVEIVSQLASGVVVQADTRAMARAVDAILENAVKYNDNPVVRIEARLTADNRTARLELSDNGVGFEPKEREAIFGRFYRLGDELTRRHPGTGLGLYLCREIIRAHGGKVTAASRGPGTGATFTIELKVLQSHEDDSAGRG